MVAFAALAACSAIPPVEADAPVDFDVITIAELASRADEFNGKRVAVEGYLGHMAGAISIPHEYLKIYGAERIEVVPGEFEVRCIDPDYSIHAPRHTVRSARKLERRRVLISGVFENEAGFVPHSPVTVEYVGRFYEVRIEKVFTDSCTLSPSVPESKKQG